MVFRAPLSVTVIPVFFHPFGARYSNMRAPHSVFLPRTIPKPMAKQNAPIVPSNNTYVFSLVTPLPHGLHALRPPNWLTIVLLIQQLVVRPFTSSTTIIPISPSTSSAALLKAVMMPLNPFSLHTNQHT